MRQRLEGMCNAIDCNKCRLDNYGCTCNFISTEYNPMSDDEIREAYKTIFKEE